MFEKINGLGYAIGKKVKEEKKESSLWDIFRTRTAEDFVTALVGIQLKLRTTLDLREVEANKSRWREIKAILLNGMANALFSPKKEGGIKDVQSD